MRKLTDLLSAVGRSAWQQLRRRDGYYYVSYQKDEKGNRKVSVATSTINLVIICVFLLLMSGILVVASRGSLPPAILAILLVFALLGVVAVWIVARSKAPFPMNSLLILIAILILIVLGVSVSDTAFLLKLFK